MNDDVVVEILARLPTRSLRRFQCVSKAWRGFISDDVPSSRRLLLPMSGLFFDRSMDHQFYAPVTADPRQHHDEEEEEKMINCSWFISRLRKQPFQSTSYVIHSCNGLLLFRGRNRKNRVIHTDSYFVWNPATNESVALPDHPGTSRSQGCFLAFDPRESPHYKAVRFAIDRDRPSEYFLQIYSSMSGDWIELCFPRPAGDRFYPCWLESKSVFLKGALHMLDPPDHLARLDVDKVIFEVLRLPVLERHEQTFHSASIGESGGELYYAVHVSLLAGLELRLWMLDEGRDGETWLLKHTISYAQILHQHPHITHVPPNLLIYILAFNPDSDVIYLTVARDKIFAYHPGSGRLEEVLYRATSDGVDFSLSFTAVFTVTPCLESLNPPGGKLFKR